MRKPVTLGRIKRLDLRDVWEREDTEFSPWLAKPENLALLAEALHLDSLVLEGTERDVGRFSADIVARDVNGLVLIENQIEPTDHRHLGQILTYLAGLEDAATVVWIAAEFLEEHRAAIDWLNANTSERFSFFGVEVQVLQIGTSDLAPDFSVVAKPNDWSRRVGSTVRRVGEAMNPLRQLYLEYWTACSDFLAHADKGLRIPKAFPQQWMTFGIGRAGFFLNLSFQREQRRIRVELFIGSVGKVAFKKLEASRAEIEQEIGMALSWEEMPGRKGSRIAVYRNDVDINDRSTWPDQFRWYADRMRDFRRVFTPRIRALDLEDDSTDGEAAGPAATG